MKKCAVCAFALLAIAAGVSAQRPAGIEDLDMLDAQIAKFAATVPGLTGVPLPLDRRLQLAKCAEIPMIEALPVGSLAIRCPSRGWRLRVAVAMPLGTPVAAQEVVIRRGDVIELDYAGDGFTINAVSRAMENGAKGQVIRVENTVTGVPASATVAGHGLAQLISDESR
jgi:flagella basal body P-ring formation protein FlgA